MTEQLHSAASEETPYDQRVTHLVDTRGISYDMARAILGPDPEESSPTNTPSHADTIPYYGPFTEPTTDVLDTIQGIEYRSQLSELRTRIAKLALRGTSVHETEAMFAALKNRREQLTYRNTEHSEG